MPLTSLVGQFEGVVYTQPEKLVERHGWLEAWKCQAWMEDDPSQVVTMLLAYRSPLCRDTKPMYRPVAEEILKADQVDVLARGFRHDDNMMHGRGEFLVARLRPHSFVESPMCPSLDEIREVVGSTVETALTGNGEMAAP
ncbi:hypothetical protein Chy4_0070 [Mycobacterium phage Chy4]|uniref:hypothetical protein n=1 Tax=Mycobacterium phage Chy5 TaxID=1327948 RepID=UPI00032B76BD|nr:hypothetical protein M178_gp69 [Mycobacterium phage Chy5]YP_008060230.1 hypothetical protein M179_gp70 [Mycobacterium phage Chy4]AGK86032.1 hypothetical protein Chy4_0070 [Mycobacterium phage Chy4]AGK86104.1 hypothetical protein Chy5_0069 [Mycobacterium phage Chy5]